MKIHFPLEDGKKRVVRALGLEFALDLSPQEIKWGFKPQDVSLKEMDLKFYPQQDAGALVAAVRAEQGWFSSEMYEDSEYGERLNAALGFSYWDLSPWSGMKILGSTDPKDLVFRRETIEVFLELAAYSCCEAVLQMRIDLDKSSPSYTGVDLFQAFDRSDATGPVSGAYVGMKLGSEGYPMLIQMSGGGRWDIEVVEKPDGVVTGTLKFNRPEGTAFTLQVSVVDKEWNVGLLPGDAPLLERHVEEVLHDNNRWNEPLRKVFSCNLRSLSNFDHSSVNKEER